MTAQPGQRLFADSMRPMLANSVDPGRCAHGEIANPDQRRTLLSEFHSRDESLRGLAVEVDEPSSALDVAGRKRPLAHVDARFAWNPAAPRAAAYQRPFKAFVARS